jgi:POT family proton-dependent oligopeptide transporter
LVKRHRELGSTPAREGEATGISFERTAFSGGQTKLEGAAYYRFFLWLMLGTAVVFVPFAMFYRPRTYLG